MDATAALALVTMFALLLLSIMFIQQYFYWSAIKTAPAPARSACADPTPAALTAQMAQAYWAMAMGILFALLTLISIYVIWYAGSAYHTPTVAQYAAIEKCCASTMAKDAATAAAAATAVAAAPHGLANHQPLPHAYGGSRVPVAHATLDFDANGYFTRMPAAVPIVAALPR